MLTNSLILYSLGKLAQVIKDAYGESYIRKIVDKLLHFFTNLMGRSLIVSFLTGRTGPESSIGESRILGAREKIGYSLAEIPKSIIRKIIDRSLIIKFILDNDGQFYLFGIMLVALPFISTSLGLILGFAIIVLTILSNIYKENEFRQPSLYLFFSILFLISIIVNGAINTGPSKAIEVFIIFVVFASFGLFVPYIVNDKDKLKLILNLISFTVVLLGIYGIYQFIFGAPMDEAWLDKDVAPNVIRVYSAFGNPNVYGEYLVLVLPIIFALFYTEKDKFKKVVYLLILILGFGNVFLTFSRGSMLSLAIAISILVILKARAYIPALLILAVLGAVALPESIIARILSIFTGGDTSTSYRKSIYQASINMLRDYYVAGTGLGQFKEIYKVYSLNAAKSFHAHNTFLMISIEMGILGIGSFFAMILSWAREIISTLKYRDDQMSFISISIFAGIVGCSIQGMVDHIWHNYDIMFMYFILLGLAISATSLAGGKGVVEND
ncbi:MAG: O-antigen ligase family protein [Tissierellaceae bacterium]